MQPPLCRSGDLIHHRQQCRGGRRAHEVLTRTLRLPNLGLPNLGLSSPRALVPVDLSTVGSWLEGPLEHLRLQERCGLLPRFCLLWVSDVEPFLELMCTVMSAQESPRDFPQELIHVMT